MKYFNSVTGEIEDDGKELELPTALTIPSGRAISPDGSMDSKFSSMLDKQNYGLKASKELELSMMQNPEKYPIYQETSNILKKDYSSGLPSSQEAAADINPDVKNYLLNKMSQQSSTGRNIGSVGNMQSSVGQNPTEAVVSEQGPQVKPPNLLEQFSPEKYKEALAQMKVEQSNTALSQLASGIGDSLARRDPSNSDKFYSDLRNNIKDQTVGEFERQKQSAISDIKTKSMIEDNDPNSENSKTLRGLMKQQLNEAGMPRLANQINDNMSGKQINDLMPQFTKMIDTKIRSEDTKAMRAMQMDYKRAELARKGSPEERLKALSGQDKARYDNALMTLKGIDEMGAALDAGQNTFSVVGDNDYTAASRRATEAYGRMQSGGAINKDEEARFEKTLPGKTDTKEMQRKKLMTQRSEMLSRLKTLGFTPEEAGYVPQDFKYGAGKSKNSKPKTIVQNGHTYTLNETTGEYE